MECFASFPCRRLCVLLTLVAVATAAGCATEGMTTAQGFAPGAALAALPSDTDQAPQIIYDDNANYAGRAVYRCDDGNTLVVENQVQTVQIGFADGTSMTLPASPADSRTRYVHEQYALVFDGNETLFMKPKSPPITCKR